MNVMSTEAKYRTDLTACSCPGYWYRRMCRHIAAYRDAVALVLAQDAANVAWDTGETTMYANIADMVEPAATTLIRSDSRPGVPTW